MSQQVKAQSLILAGLDSQLVQKWEDKLNCLLKNTNPQESWNQITREYLKPDHPFALHQYLYEINFSEWNIEDKGPYPAWTPTSETIQESHIQKWIEKKGYDSYQQLYDWSIRERGTFWEETLQSLGIVLKSKQTRIADFSKGIDKTQWLVDAKMNISDSCFNADPETAAIVYQKESGSIERFTYQELDLFSNRVANGLVKLGFQKGDPIAIDMPMTVEAVAIYVGLVKAGMVAVSIADSFAPAEIQTRLRIAKAKAIFTQDYLIRGGKQLPLYQKVKEANAPKAIVLSSRDSLSIELRKGDISWNSFLSKKDTFESVVCLPDEATNILFSSGTTGDPKAIPWTHLTPIKSAADGYFHHDIHPGDVVAWPTNLGWMMGPWLIYASLINKATMALYYEAPTSFKFGQFVQEAKVTMLGLVPSIVKVWKQTNCLKGCDWSTIKVFSSTGECSNSDDYFYLMSRVHGYRPVIEYCGGTEIGGGYITGTVVQPASPAIFTTPSLGLGVEVLDEEGRPAKNGELFLVPPSIGLSSTLLNRDHFEVYYKDTPKGPAGEILRRHGDQMEKLPNGFFRAHGRADDTMNLGGVKVSSAEIERTLNAINGVNETAAIAVSPEEGGPSELVIYAVLAMGNEIDLDSLKMQMQKRIKADLNPLFKVGNVVTIDTLPRTASNKVMRRVLRAKYEAR